MSSRPQIARGQFVAAIGQRQHAPQQKFLMDALTGILKSGNTTLCAWARTLRGATRFENHVKRLSRNMCSRRFKDDVLADDVLRAVAPIVRKHCTTIALDHTDIAKPYARKMPHQHGVYDGSKGEIGFGWSVLRADAVSDAGAHLPLWILSNSPAAPEWQGEHADVRRLMMSVHAQLSKHRFVWVVDRGFDGATWRDLFDELKIHFVVRANARGTASQRWVSIDGADPVRLSDLVDSTLFCTRTRVAMPASRKSKSWRLHVGWQNGVSFSDSKRKYSIVVARYDDGTRDPMVLITDQRVLTDAQANTVVKRYFSRWAIEDGNRFMKEQMSLENLRVLTWRGIKRAVLLAHVAFAFLAWMVHVFRGTDQLMKDAPVTGRVPRFPYYRLRIALEATSESP